MIVVGLTGPIGSGKSTIVQALSHHGIACFDADACVHRLFERPEITKRISSLLPSAVNMGGVDRVILADKAFDDENFLNALEELIHPLVWDECRHFLDTHEKAGASLVVIDIPLLFEKGYAKLCSCVIVLQCSEAILTRRVLQRSGMTLKRIKQILKRQGSWEEKNKRADYILDAEGPFEQTLSHMYTLFEDIKKRFTATGQKLNDKDE